MLAGDDVPDTVAVVLPAEHTMGSSLRPYLESRVHELCDLPTIRRIRVLGSHDRGLMVSAKEKADKLENWQRPTARQVGDEIEVHCFPGRAHVFHHGSMIASKLAGEGKDPSIVQLELPSPSKVAAEVGRMRLNQLTPTRIALVASGWSWLGPPAENWIEQERLYFTRRSSLGPEVTCLAVKHSFWGDIAFHLGRHLATSGFGSIIFVGKLGSLDPAHVPNQTIVSGSSSTVAGRELRWTDALGGLRVLRGRHITLPSVLQETTRWMATVGNDFDLVDPEIGNFAAGATAGGARFGFLHIVSDNLSRRYPHDLSNEREEEVRRTRGAAYEAIERLLREVL